MLLTRGEAVQRNTSAEGVPVVRKQIQDLKDSWDSLLSASIQCKRCGRALMCQCGVEEFNSRLKGRGFESLFLISRAYNRNFFDHHHPPPRSSIPFSALLLSALSSSLFLIILLLLFSYSLLSPLSSLLSPLSSPLSSLLSSAGLTLSAPCAVNTVQRASVLFTVRFHRVHTVRVHSWSTGCSSALRG